MKSLFFSIVLTSLVFFSACANAQEAPEEGVPEISATEAPDLSATETPASQPSITKPPVTEPSITELPIEEKITPVPSVEKLAREEALNNAWEDFEEALARKNVTDKIWEAFEEVRDDQNYPKDYRFQELILESRGTLHIALITRKPITKTEKNLYQGEGRVYLVFYDESKGEEPYFLCKSFGCLFEADIFGDEEGMYLSLITRHSFEDVEFYHMSSFSLTSEGCFEAVFAEDELTYWQDRKPEFEESRKVKLYKRVIRRAFFYSRLLNDPDSMFFGSTSYSWEYETDIDLSRLTFDKHVSVRVLNESTVFTDLASLEYDRNFGWNKEYQEDRFVIIAGFLTMPDGSILITCKELVRSQENVAILLYDKDGTLLDGIYKEAQLARIIQNTEQNCFEIHAWQVSQGWEGVNLSGKVRAENGKIVIEPDEEQGKTYVEDFSGWLQ